MEIINNYDKIKGLLKNNISKTLNWLKEGENFGISFEEEINKLQNIINNLEDSKIKIAIVGAFSEGKTTMVASWLGKVENDMKIHHEESSDAISIYKPLGLENKCVIVDTPGLFGNKEIENENGLTKYKEITQKYVSEAHLIFYVINPINLIKDSHKETCNWLFRDLKKLENTVFVINKFDELVDLEDEEDYKNALEIKKNSFIKTLDRFINLKESEINKLNIIAISANPYAEGLEHWFNNLDQFNTISRIQNLRNITDSVISKSSTSIYTNQVSSVIKDVVNRKKNDIIEVLESQNKLIETSDFNLKNIKKEIDDTNKDLKNNLLNLKKEILDFLTNLEQRIEDADTSNLGKIFKSEIGEESIILNTNIELIINRYLDRSIDNLKNLNTKITSEINFSETISNNFATGLLKKGLTSTKAIPLSNMKNIVLNSRNLLTKSINSLGGNIALKFKPWGATKLAKGLGTTFAIVGFLFEGYELYKAHEKKQEYEKAKKDIKNFLLEYQKGYNNLLSDIEKFKTENFSEINSYYEIYEEIKRENERLKSIKENLNNWFNSSTQIQEITFENM